jgi:hypothetical protein
MHVHHGLRALLMTQQRQRFIHAPRKNRCNGLSLVARTTDSTARVFEQLENERRISSVGRHDAVIAV